MTTATKDDVKPFVVIAKRRAGREREWNRYADFQSAQRAAAQLKAIGVEARVVEVTP